MDWDELPTFARDGGFDLGHDHWAHFYGWSPDRELNPQYADHPLHIEPSLLCRGCGDHGFIRGGRWVPA